MGRFDSDANWVLGENDLWICSPSELDKYRPAPDWSLETKNQRSVLIEIWRRVALIQSYMFPLLYGTHPGKDMPRLGPRRVAGGLYQYQLRNPHKHRMEFVSNTWADVNARWDE